MREIVSDRWMYIRGEFVYTTNFGRIALVHNVVHRVSRHNESINKLYEIDFGVLIKNWS